jgi:hypothetical protein
MWLRIVSRGCTVEPLEGRVQARRGLGPGVRGERLLERPPGTRLVCAVWQLDPGARSPHYHTHHTAEEMLLTLCGEPTLRTPAGERQLAEGEVSPLPGRSCGCSRGAEPLGRVVRYLMIAAHGHVDAIEYIDESGWCVQPRRLCASGGAGVLLARVAQQRVNEIPCSHCPGRGPSAPVNRSVDACQVLHSSISSPPRRALPVVAETARRSNRTPGNHHGPSSGPDFPADWAELVSAQTIRSTRIRSAPCTQQAPA